MSRFPPDLKKEERDESAGAIDDSKGGARSHGGSRYLQLGKKENSALILRKKVKSFKGSSNKGGGKKRRKKTLQRLGRNKGSH